MVHTKVLQHVIKETCERGDIFFCNCTNIKLFIGKNNGQYTILQYIICRPGSDYYLLYTEYDF